MKVQIKEQLYIETNNQNILQELRTILDKPNPEYAKKKAMGYVVYNIPPRIKMFEKTEKGIIIPRGTGRLARELAKKHGELFSVEDHRTCDNPIDVSLKSEIEPYWYQKDAVKVMLDKQQGMVEAPCGSGKTAIGLFLVAELKQRTLIVVHTKDLFTQWYNRINEFLEGGFTIGRIGSGHKQHGDITIAMIQTLSKLAPKDLEKIKSNYSIFLGDESHHFGANTYIKCMRNIQSKYVFGLTATPKRTDKKDFIVHAYLGNVIHTVRYDSLETSGRAVTCKINLVDTGLKYNFTKMGENFSTLGSTISRDRARNELIIEKVMEDLNDNRIPMLLTERVYHAKFLVSLLRAEGIKVDSITGTVDSYTRDAIKQQLKDKEIQVLVANKQIAAEGLDLPLINSIHICFLTNNKNLIKQMIGRGRRVYEYKEYCRVWFYKDFVYKMEYGSDFNLTPVEVTGLKYQHLGIRKWFKDQGFEIN